MRTLPPVYFAVSAAAMVGLGNLASGPRWLWPPWTSGGLALLIAGPALTLFGAGLFKKYGTPIKPFQTPSTLVTTGPYRYTRNPMYLGMALALTGIAIVLGTTTPPIIIPLFMWLITTLFIQDEEHALEGKFGQDYRDYKKNIRRWL